MKTLFILYIIWSGYAGTKASEHIIFDDRLECLRVRSHIAESLKEYNVNISMCEEVK
jgi:hypothetical protein